jgi:hypothetical protein
MEIKRRVEMQVATSRKFIIRQPQAAEPIFCQTCGGATAEQTAAVFGINQRAVFQFIETGAAHFAETSAGAVMICLPTLAALLPDKNEIQPPKVEG